MTDGRFVYTFEALKAFCGLSATSVPSNGPPSRGIGVTSIDPQLMGAITRLVELLDTPNDIGALSPLVLREIAYRLLTSAQGSRLRQIVAPGAPAQRIARAIAWLKEHFAEPARVEALAKHVALSPSAFICISKRGRD